MKQHGNQHFVPQFYFRRFSGGRNAINLILVASGETIQDAPIKGQCAAHNFYGSKELELLFGGLEGAHAKTLKTIGDAAWKGDLSGVTSENIASLCEVVLFQRSRTALEFDKSKDVPNAMALPAFRAHIATAPCIKDRQRILEAIDKRQLRIEETRVSAVLQAMDIAMDGVLLVSDLALCVLRNHTKYPFIFSDSPVVFYNTLMRDVTSRGVLGLQSPGLQIFYPISPNMILMMYDEATYSIAHTSLIDVKELWDVSQLNALQLQHSLDAVYFGDSAAQQYVSDLWWAHRRNVDGPKMETRTLRNVLVRGQSEPCDVLLHLEPHLKLRLGLSFISCEPIRDRDYRFRHRSPQLVAEHREWIKLNEASAGRTSRALKGG
ncbi:MAG: DUF4238 domain-containing protein [Tepidisphaeraceae bacterium]